jgi:hypothetical protein
MPGVNSVAKSSLYFFSLRQRERVANADYVQFVDRFSVATGLEQVKILEGSRGVTV